MLSVYIDTLLLCAATAIMCLSSGIAPAKEISGALYVQQALATVFKGFGPIFITAAMILFAFTTLLGNLFYVEKGLTYLNNRKTPGKAAMVLFYIIASVIIYLGAVTPMKAAWAAADITMGGMTIINIPVCIILSSIVVRTFRNYERQKMQGMDPVFRAEDIQLDTENLDYWKEA